MRKKCKLCGWIGFPAVDECGKCRSIELELTSKTQREGLNEEPAFDEPRSTILKHLGYAVMLEFGAMILTLPMIAGGMMRHSAEAPYSGSDIGFMALSFALHFPTVAITYLLSEAAQFPFLLFTPITQIAFLTYYFEWRKRQKHSET